MFEVGSLKVDMGNPGVINMVSPIGIELVTPLTREGPATKNLERKGEGMTMLAMEVPNLEKAVSDMDSHGVRLVAYANPPVGKAAIFHPKDLFGVMIELIERKV